MPCTCGWAEVCSVERGLMHGAACGRRELNTCARLGVVCDELYTPTTIPVNVVVIILNYEVDGLPRFLGLELNKSQE